MLSLFSICQRTLELSPGGRVCHASRGKGRPDARSWWKSEGLEPQCRAGSRFPDVCAYMRDYVDERMQTRTSTRRNLAVPLTYAPVFVLSYYSCRTYSAPERRCSLFCLACAELQQDHSLLSFALTALQKGGVPAAPSGTATLLRLSPNHQFCLRPILAVTDFRHPRLSWLDGRCVQGPGTYSPRHG